MKLQKEKERFEKEFAAAESVVLRFHGVDGFDVYNCSIPFAYAGKRYIYGRVERREEWMRSWVRLFVETGTDEWTLVPDSMIYQLEDPFISLWQDQLILGGTHVRIAQEKLDTYYDYFYRGRQLENLKYFATGPDFMKDIRLVQLADGRLGIFSRPRVANEASIGFAIVDDLDALTAEAVQHAVPLSGILGEGEWGGCNQAYLLESGKIGVIGHQSYSEIRNGQEVLVYLNTAFVMDPLSLSVLHHQIIGARSSYPAGPAKKPELVDCAFTSGIVMRPDGMADLYSGIGDCQEGRVVIPYPFAGFGAICQRDACIWL